MTRVTCSSLLEPSSKTHVLSWKTQMRTRSDRPQPRCTPAEMLLLDARAALGVQEMKADAFALVEG
jgi:hypothetical protein